MKQLNTRLGFGLVLLFLALPPGARASSSAALKRYEAGKYESALREYKRLLMEKPDDSRLHFNAGAAAFQVKDFEEARKQLNAALVTQDLPLQERTYYNLGNTEYRLGAEAQAPDKKQTEWEQAVNNYESALKLNPKDEDAKFNMELVKKQLEELQKQQQQQKQQSKDDQNKEDQNKQNQDQKDQSQKEQQSKEDKSKQQDQKQEQKNPDQQKPKPDQNQDDKKPEEQQAQQKPDSSKDDKKQAEAKKANESKENKPENGEEQQAQAMKGVTARMTPEQAQLLLDAQKADEKAMIFVPKLKTNRADRVFKDW